MLQHVATVKADLQLAGRLSLSHSERDTTGEIGAPPAHAWKLSHNTVVSFTRIPAHPQRIAVKVHFALHLLFQEKKRRKENNIP